MRTPGGTLVGTRHALPGLCVADDRAPTKRGVVATARATVLAERPADRAIELWLLELGALGDRSLEGIRRRLAGARHVLG
jgi:hypothetical protein